MKPALTGTRIRARRGDLGMRQAELARLCGISPSYLNLIEHNRRRIGGKLLNRIARHLGADPATLAEGGDSEVSAALRAAADLAPEAEAEIARAEEFAGRFPGWARLVAAQNARADRLERIVEALRDRLTNDPFLSASLHEVLSSVTAIQSASGILIGGGIEPEWQSRFHRNIYEDSQRLAFSAEALVSYLDAGVESEPGPTLPLDEVEAWLDAQGWRIAALEADPDGPVGTIVETAKALTSRAAREIAGRAAGRYAADARALPADRLEAVVRAGEADPLVLAARFGVGVPLMLRRLATLPADAFPDGETRGLLVCDGSGALTVRKAAAGFEPPRLGAACPLWPLYQALQRPGVPVRRALRLAGRDERHFVATAMAEMAYPAGFDGPAVVEATMLVEVRLQAEPGLSGQTVGTSCRVCPLADCPARREPSIMAGLL